MNSVKKAVKKSAKPLSKAAKSAKAIGAKVPVAKKTSKLVPKKVVSNTTTQAKVPSVSVKKKVSTTQKVVKKTVYKNRYLKIFSRHPSISPLRKSILTPLSIVYRHGSTTEVSSGKYDVEINTPEAIRNSSSKLRMKNKFQEAGVKTAVWYTYNGAAFMQNGAVVNTPVEFPIVAKHIFGSRGEGNYLLNSSEEFNRWLAGKTLANYIFEKFYNYNREYRLHVTASGCFYTCRKMLKSDTPKEDRWFRNDSNSVWIIEENPDFDKPVNWSAIEKECVKALQSCGLDVGACDVRVQSSKNDKGKERKEVDFIVLEVNSAPSMGEITLQKYAEALPKIAASKHSKFSNKI